MCKVTHGSIILCEIPQSDFNPHANFGTHFYIIVSNNAACKHSPVVNAIPCSSNAKRRLPTQCEVLSEAFDRRTYAQAEQLTLLPKAVLEQGRLMGYLTPESMRSVEECLKVQLGLP